MNEWGRALHKAPVPDQLEAMSARGVQSKGRGSNTLAIAMPNSTARTGSILMQKPSVTAAVEAAGDPGTGTRQVRVHRQGPT